jgi:nucleotide-binding universal stress UspA family protein
MQAGRPLLVVPESCGWLDLRSVVVAWKDTAEARRAVVDALPVLKAAEEITIAQVIEEQNEWDAAWVRLHDVSAWLARHGVQAFERVERGEAAPQLEKIASSLAAGLIVAGAYRHSRLHAWIFWRRDAAPDLVLQACSLLSR